MYLHYFAVYFKNTFYVIYELSLKSFSDAILSQQPSPKNFLQKILSLILTKLDQIHRDLLKNMRKKM